MVAGSRIQFFMLSASMALSVATTAMVARAWGARDQEAASAASTASLSLTVIITILLGVGAYTLADTAIGLFSLDAASHKIAANYVRAAAISYAAFSGFMTLTTALRAIGDVMRPLYFTFFASALSISLSYYCVYGLSIAETQLIPEFGPVGVVWGTAIGQGMVASTMLGLWAMGRYQLGPIGRAWTDWALVARLIRIGFPAMLEQLLLQTSFILFMVLIARFGTPAFAAYGIGITVLTVCIVVGLGFGTASAALSGQAIGADAPERARSSGWAAMRLAIFSMTLISLLTVVAREPMAYILTADPEVRVLTTSFIYVLAAIQPLMAIEFALGGALRGAGDTRYPLFVTIAGNIVTRLSIGLIVIAMGLDVQFLYAVIVFDYLVKAILLIFRFRGNRWLQEGAGKPPTALPSLAGVSRAAIRLFYGRAR